MNFESPKRVFIYLYVYKTSSMIYSEVPKLRGARLLPGVTECKIVRVRFRPRGFRRQMPFCWFRYICTRRSVTFSTCRVVRGRYFQRFFRRRRVVRLFSIVKTRPAPDNGMEEKRMYRWISGAHARTSDFAGTNEKKKPFGNRRNALKRRANRIVRITLA